MDLPSGDPKVWNKSHKYCEANFIIDTRKRSLLKIFSVKCAELRHQIQI
jgi:hypothetical protein